MIPGFLITILTFPGVIIHELAHLLFCKLFKLRVHEVCFFRLGNPAGYVIHERPTLIWQSLLVSVGPFFVNTIVGFVIALFVPMFNGGDRDAAIQFGLIWLSVSIAMHAFPSTGDANAMWAAAFSKGTHFLYKVLTVPLVVIIYLGALGSVVWLDAAYGIGIMMSASTIARGN